MINSNNISTISDLRFKTKEVFKKAASEPVLLFNRSTPTGVLLSWENYQDLVSTLEDFYLSLKAEDFEKEDKKKIKWTSHEQIKKRFLRARP